MVTAIAEDREGKLVVAGRNGLDVIVNGTPMGPYSPRFLSTKTRTSAFSLITLEACGLARRIVGSMF